MVGYALAYDQSTPMSHILCVGIAALDIINLVDHYPAEDEELRARSQRVARGGNAANTAAVLAQLGQRVDFLGMLAEEPDGRRIEQDLLERGVSTRHCPRRAGKAPTSYILLNEASGSRTIVHYRDLPELDYDHFTGVPVERFDWLHFEGRHVAETRRMLEHARRRMVDQPMSVEIEKERPDIEALYPLADVLLFSRAFVRGRGLDDPQAWLERARAQAPQALLVCTWGEQGAYALDLAGEWHHSPAFPPPRVVDTVGAGDTFNAGFIDAMLSGRTPAEALSAGCRLAGRKVGQIGFDGLGPASP